jgi:transcriptional regulator with XRE-family HTH domain
MDIRAALAQQRRTRDISQKQAGVLCGVSQETFRRWEVGESRPKDENVPAVARFLKMPQAEVRSLIGARLARRANTSERIDELTVRVDGLEEAVRDLAEAVRQATGHGPEAPQ